MADDKTPTAAEKAAAEKAAAEKAAAEKAAAEKAAAEKAAAEKDADAVKAGTQDAAAATKDTASYRAKLGGKLPFASMDIPGMFPTVVITRAGTLMTGEQKKTLEAAVKAGKVAGVTMDNLIIEKI